MDTKEKTVSKEELHRLIENDEFAGFFAAIDKSDWKYDKPIYTKLRSNFTKKGLDTATDHYLVEALKVFVGMLGEHGIEKAKEKEEIELDIDKINRMIKKLEYGMYLINFTIFLLFLLLASYAVFTFLTSQNPLNHTKIIFMNAASYVILLIPHFIQKNNRRIYQLLVGAVIVFYDGEYTAEVTNTISRAKRTLADFISTNENYVKYLRFYFSSILIFTAITVSISLLSGMTK